MKLLCDQMLGSLAKWLRIMGFNTFYATMKMTDEDILCIAKKEQRTLLTRDKELIQRAKKEQIPLLEITTTKLDTQLLTVLNRIRIDETMVLSRCILCNTVLDPVEKQMIKSKVPQRIFDTHDIFWFCHTCDKVYWKGTHYENIVHTLTELKTQSQIPS